MNLFRQNCCLVFGLCLGILLAGSVRAELAVLQFSSAQTETAKEILEKLSQHHYRKLALDDQSSAEIFDNFIDTLDPLKSYYLQSDIDEFARYRDRLDDALLNEDLEPGFALYNRFRKDSIPLIIQIFIDPSFSETNASWSPLGLNSGDPSNPRFFVNKSASLPSAFTK